MASTTTAPSPTPATTTPTPTPTPAPTPASATSSTSSTSNPKDELEDPIEIVNEFSYLEGQIEREKELNRVLNESFKLNPLEILNLPSTATSNDVSKQFRRLSLLLHPDKISPEQRENAQKAFAILTKAKEDLLDEQKRANLNKIVIEAEEKVKAKRDEETKQYIKKFKKDNPTKEPPPLTWPDSFELAVHQQTKELLIDMEYRRRQYLKMAAAEEGKAQAEAEQKKKDREDREKVQKDWEEGRERRVSSWRDFSKVLSKKRKLQPFKTPDAKQREPSVQQRDYRDHED